MEHMESKMQDQYDAWDARERETYEAGFERGLREAAEMLRHHAGDYEKDYLASKKVAEGLGQYFAANLLRSFANGLEMRADNVKGPICKVEFGQ